MLMINIDLGLNWAISYIKNNSTSINTIWAYVIIGNQKYSTGLFYAYFGISTLASFLMIIIYSILLILEDSIRDFFGN